MMLRITLLGHVGIFWKSQSLCVAFSLQGRRQMSLPLTSGLTELKLLRGQCLIGPCIIDAAGKGPHLTDLESRVYYQLSYRSLRRERRPTA
jgi:hypothetical protein